MPMVSQKFLANFKDTTDDSDSPVPIQEGYEADAGLPARTGRPIKYEQQKRNASLSKTSQSKKSVSFKARHKRLKTELAGPRRSESGTSNYIDHPHSYAYKQGSMMGKSSLQSVPERTQRTQRELLLNGNKPFAALDVANQPQLHADLIQTQRAPTKEKPFNKKSSQHINHINNIGSKHRRDIASLKEQKLRIMGSYVGTIPNSRAKDSSREKNRKKIKSIMPSQLPDSLVGLPSIPSSELHQVHIYGGLPYPSANPKPKQKNIKLPPLMRNRNASPVGQLAGRNFI